MKKRILKLAVATAWTLPMGAQATLYHFAIQLDQAQEIAASADPVVPGKRALVPGTSSAFGTGNAVYDDVANIFTHVAVTGIHLQGGVVNQHIHIGAPGVSGPVALNMPSPINNAFGNVAIVSHDVGEGTVGNTSGTAAVFFVDPSEEAAILAGNAYFNIHTTFDTAGEIRGQLVPVPEPETYALMLAGLGLVGLVAVRRRKVCG